MTGKLTAVDTVARVVEGLEAEETANMGILPRGAGLAQDLEFVK